MIVSVTVGHSVMLVVELMLVVSVDAVVVDSVVVELVVIMVVVELVVSVVVVVDGCGSSSHFFTETVFCPASLGSFPTKRLALPQ